jgi:hypothetical protein
MFLTAIKSHKIKINMKGNITKRSFHDIEYRNPEARKTVHLYAVLCRIPKVDRELKFTILKVNLSW